MWLTPADLECLTGYKSSAAMRRWLDAHRWRYVVSAAGWPVVALAEAERHLVGKSARAPAQPRLELVR